MGKVPDLTLTTTPGRSSIRPGRAATTTARLWLPGRQRCLAVTTGARCNCRSCLCPLRRAWDEAVMRMITRNIGRPSAVSIRDYPASDLTIGAA
jgi:hypothetical protein